MAAQPTTPKPELHVPVHPVRIVTASALFDGHDASINIMRRIMQSQGAEVIHLGHNRSVREVVDAAIVDGTAHLNVMLTGMLAAGCAFEQRATGLLDGGVSRCKATTRKGKACQRTPLPGRDYCPSHQHLEQSTVGRAAAIA